MNLKFQHDASEFTKKNRDFIEWMLRSNDPLDQKIAEKFLEAERL